VTAFGRSGASREGVVRLLSVDERFVGITAVVQIGASREGRWILQQCSVTALVLISVRPEKGLFALLSLDFTTVVQCDCLGVRPEKGLVVVGFYNSGAV